MKNFRLKIGDKILGGFITLIVFFALNGIFSLITLKKSNDIIKESSEVVNPSLAAINDYTLLVTRSKMLVTNWVYLQMTEEEKQELRTIHEEEYPVLRDKIVSLQSSWNERKQILMMDSIYRETEQLLAYQDNIMTLLATWEDKEDFMKRAEAVETIDDEVIPRSKILLSQLEAISAIKKTETKASEESLIASFGSLQNTIIILGLIVIFIGVIGGIWMAKSITKPILYIKDIIVNLGKGELPESSNKKFAKDEIGEMAIAVENLIEGLKGTTTFAENIGNGQYNADFQPLSDKDVLGNALIEMRNNLRNVAEEDKRRSWATEGLARFGDILRSNGNNVNELSDEIISTLVKYLKANQGGLFIIKDTENREDTYMELAACYAWDKKKYVEQKVYEGEGMTGQVWIEGETIHLTEIPENYITITSGLGEANPNSILIVPLKVNEEIFGVLEIASFNVFDQYQVDFVEKIAESIASTISAVKTNERTQKLLEESTEMTEQMRSQEEEMRQNMEELQATQEEMERGQRDREAKDTIINATNLQIELDEQLNISSCNELLARNLNYRTEDLKGKSLALLIAEKDDYTALQSKIQAGNPFANLLKLRSKNGKEVYISMACGKIVDTFNDTTKYLIFATDISELALEALANRVENE